MLIYLPIIRINNIIIIMILIILRIIYQNTKFMKGILKLGLF